MIGRRKYFKKAGDFDLNEGEYGRGRDGFWYVRPPGVSMSCRITKHAVVEHPDATITVSPSILLADGPERFHGYLERGVWRVLPA